MAAKRKYQLGGGDISSSFPQLRQMQINAQASKIKNVEKPLPETYNIKDPRTISLTTNKPINPNRDLLGGVYNTNRIADIVRSARMYNVDPYLAVAIDLQETGLGKRSDAQAGHASMQYYELVPSVLDAPEEEIRFNDIDLFLRNIVTKQKLANKLGIKDPATQIQVYNGLGSVYPKTEKGYHGYEMQKIYGVPLTKKGINLRENPLYGKRIIDIRDNILKKDKNFEMLLKNIKKTGGPVTVKKAKEILKDGTIHGKPLTDKQRGFFGYIAGGGKPKMQYAGDFNMLNDAIIAANELIDEGYYMPTYQGGGYINNTGYLDGAATSINPFNIIPSNVLTMQGVSQDIMAYPNAGEPMLMKANDKSKYYFPNADYVIETPIMAKGGKTCAMCGGKMPCKCGGKVKMKDGGEMLKRADGSYSRRGLWDNIRDNAGSGKKPTKAMLEQERKLKSLQKYENGGEPNGEMALGQMAAVSDKMAKLLKFVKPEDNLDPWIASKLAVMDHSADAISDYMIYGAEGDEEEMEEMQNGGIPQRYKNLGFNKVGVKRKSTRPGKKWMVLAKKGTQYKIVHGGDSNMQDYTQHHSKKRQKNFWNRMGGRSGAKAKDPFSPLYWHKRFGTWQEGGEVDAAQMNEQELMQILQMFAETNNMTIEELMSKLEQLPEDQMEKAIDDIIEDVQENMAGQTENENEQEGEMEEENGEEEGNEEEEPEVEVEEMRMGGINIDPENEGKFTQPKKQKGGGILEVGGVERQFANSELEQGEVYEDNNGMIKKVSDGEPTHEDGGSPQPNVSRVLEDTADKRRDLDSKILKIKPEEAEMIVGFKPKKTTTHSRLFEEASKYYDGKAKGLEKKIKTNFEYVKYSNGGQYAQNSLDENLKMLSKIPTKANLFDIIYNHQEEVKAKYGIGQENQQMRVGGLPKFQTAGANEMSGFYPEYTSNIPKVTNNVLLPPDVKNLVEQKYANLAQMPQWAPVVAALNMPKRQYPLPKWFEYWTQSKTTKGGKSATTGKPTTYDPTMGNQAYDDYEYWRGLYGKDFAGKADYQKFVFETIAKYQPKMYEYIMKEWGMPASGRLDDEYFGARTAYASGQRPTQTKSIFEPVAQEKPVTTTPPPEQKPTPGTEPTPVDEKYGKPLSSDPSKFNEPLRWFDVAGTMASYLSALEREPVGLEQLQFRPLQARELNPLPALMQSQADYNAAIAQIPTSGVGMANVANLLGSKYNINNQILGQYENLNKDRLTQMDQFNLQNQMAIEQANLGLRDQFMQRVLRGKEVQRQSKLNAFDDYLTKLAQNRKLNREGNLIMQLTPYFNQYGQYNQNRYNIVGQVGDLNTQLQGQGFKAEVAKDKKSIDIKDKDNKVVMNIPSVNR